MHDICILSGLFLAEESEKCYKYYVSASKHVLVIDDETDIVDLVSYNLKKEGFLVDSALDGETALAKIKNGKYDLLDP